MRILQVSTFDRAGGAEDIAYGLHRAWLERGHDSHIAVGVKRGDDPGVLTIPNLETRPRLARLAHPLETRLRRSDPNGVRAARAVAVATDPRRYAEVLKGHEDFDFPGTARLLELPPQRPEVVHAHNLHGGYFDLRELPRLSTEVPFLITLHDEWLFTGHCAHPIGHERWREGCGTCPQLDTYPAVLRDATAWNLQRKAAIYARSRLYLATPSQWLMDRVRDSVLAPAIADARVIPNGVDQSTFAPGDRAAARHMVGLPGDRPIVMFAAYQARSNPFKDYATLDRMVDVLGRAGGELTVVCVGEAAPPRESGAVRLLHVAHQSSPADLAPYYQAADAYVHATKADTFPTTILEAMSCGLPVVATETGGVPEQVEDGVTGFLSPPGDAEALAANVRRVTDDRSGAEAMGAGGADVARRRFDARTMVESYEQWLAELAALNRAAARG
jgi:glycosyltransferase involved in cell wall biosynthesis